MRENTKKPGRRLDTIAMCLGLLCVILPLNGFVFGCTVTLGAALTRSRWREGWGAVALLVLHVLMNVDRYFLG